MSLVANPLERRLNTVCQKMNIDSTFEVKVTTLGVTKKCGEMFILLLWAASPS